MLVRSGKDLDHFHAPVRARGIFKGGEVERSCHLLAEGGDGPYIPSMAVEAIRPKAIGRHPPGSRRPTHRSCSGTRGELHGSSKPREWVGFAKVRPVGLQPP